MKTIAKSTLASVLLFAALAVLPSRVSAQSGLPVVVDFSGKPTIGLAPLVVYFTNLSRGATNLNWDFGDGTGSTEANPVHTYGNVGTYSVTLTARGSDGTKSSTRINYIVVTGATNPPTATIRYVSLSGGNVFPFTNWANAATTIQAAVDVTANGDTVLVTNGTYQSTGGILYGSNVVAVTKAITVRAVNGPEHTVVDGNGAARGFLLSHEGAVVEGFKITGGYATAGAGAYIRFGGTLSNCVVIANSTPPGNFSSPDMIWGGGGVQCWHGGLVSGCVVSGNSSRDYAGGIACYQGGTLDHCLIEKNSGGCGGVLLWDAVAVNCLIRSNSATTGAGGMSLGGPASVARNCIVFANSATNLGDNAGGILCSTDGLVENCTVLGNVANSEGGGIYTFGGRIRNTIIYSNSAGTGSNWYSARAEDRYSYCCTVPFVQGDGNITTEPALADPLAGDFHLKSAYGRWTGSAWVSDAITSPCIDAGDPASSFANEPMPNGGRINIGAYGNTPHASRSSAANFTAAPTTGPAPLVVYFTNLSVGATSYHWDFGDGNSSTDVHPVHTYAQLGRYSVTLTATGPDGVSTRTRTSYIVVGGLALATTRYVSLSGGNVPPFTNWATAATSIQAAIDVSADGDTVLVTNGIYSVSSPITVTGAVTVTSVNGPGVTVVNGNNFSRCFFLAQSSPVVSGFTIRGGNAGSGYGGGMYVDRCAPAVSNCLFLSNSARGGGGGMYNAYSSPNISNCEFRQNSVSANGSPGGTGTSGGAMVNSSSSPTLTNCKFIQNSAQANGNGGGGSVWGGAIINSSSSPTLVNCIFSQNSIQASQNAGGSSVRGGAIMNWSGSNPILLNCIFTGNSAMAKGNAGGNAVWGGAASDGSPRCTNCTFYGNSVQTDSGSPWGGGLCSGSPILHNCILWANSEGTATNQNAQIHLWGGTPAVNYSCIQGLSGSLGGVGNISSDPQFVNPASDDYHLKSVGGHWTGTTWTNDAVTSLCIDAGDPASPYDDEPMPNGGRINIGAYGNTPEASKSPSAPLVVADFVANPTTGPTPLTVYFTNLSSGATNFLWNFGDGNSSAGENPAHTYTAAGSYSVTLTAAGPVGTNSLTRTNFIVALRPNHPPQADASATSPIVISPNSINAQVVLNGSRSSDPDGDPLHHVWYQAGNPNAIASGVVAVVTLPLGKNALVLAVDDGSATNTQPLVVEVITTGQAVERLRTWVRADATKPQPLLAALSAAMASLERGNLTAAINQLQAFQNQVRAQVAPIDPELAAQLIRVAQEIINALGGNDDAHGRFVRVERLDHGKVRIKVTPPSATTPIIEASTNLLDWETVGVASETGVGTFQWTDPDAARLPTRFYRVRSLPPGP